MSQLTAWEDALNRDLLAAYRTLAVAHADSPVLDLARGERAFLNVSGIMTNGDVATGALLSGIQWSSSDSRVAEVAPGSIADGRPIVVARSQGGAVLSAQVGLQQLQVRVAVSGPAGRTASVPCETGVGAPPGAGQADHLRADAARRHGQRRLGVRGPGGRRADRAGLVAFGPALRDRWHRGLHDRAAGTLVVCRRTVR